MFKSKTLKGKQEELKKMNYIDLLEETGKASVYEDLENIEELQEVLTSLNYITSLKDDYLIFDNRDEKRDYRINEMKRKLIKNKGGSGGYTYRVSLPIDFIRELDLEDEDELVMYVENGEIRIRKDE